MRWIAILLMVAGCATSQSITSEPSQISLPARAVAYIPTEQNPLCAVTKVVDGDTVHIYCTKGGGPVRLTGYDTPETFQARCAAEKALGDAATLYLTQILSNATVIAPRHEGVDRYGRALASLTLDGDRLADIMIREGYAVRYNGGRRIDWCERLSA